MNRSKILFLLFHGVRLGPNATAFISSRGAQLSIPCSRDKTLQFFTPGIVAVDEEFIPCPNREFDSQSVVTLCMDALMSNSKPFDNAGLEVCFNFSSDRCRAALGGSLENFIVHASNPVFGSMVDSQSWEMMNKGSLIPGSSTRGAMQTFLIQVTPTHGRKRRFLWTLQQERRPPRQGCWLVHECISVENAFSLTL